MGSYAVAVLNLNEGGYLTAFNLTLDSLGVKGQQTYNVTEVFSGAVLCNKMTTSQKFPVAIDTNSVLLLKYTKLSSGKKHEKESPYFKMFKSGLSSFN